MEASDKSMLMRLRHEHIEYVRDAMRNSSSDVRNIRNYLLTVLYNAPTTMEVYYTAAVNRDMYGGS